MTLKKYPPEIFNINIRKILLKHLKIYLDLKNYLKI